MIIIILNMKNALSSIYRGLFMRSQKNQIIIPELCYKCCGNVAFSKTSIDNHILRRK